ncbi:MAG: transposase [Opitutaceae bacterium]
MTNQPVPTVSRSGATSPGDIAEPSQTLPLVEQHQDNTGHEVVAAVADRQYGTVENYCDLVERGIRPHISPMLRADHRSEGRYTKEEFLYDAANDRYLCPAGQSLRPKRTHKRRQMTDYVADKKICAACPLRENCTASKVGRSIARHWKEETLEFARALARLPEAYADRARRRHLMEGSFARSANLHHFKRARWRRLWRQQIQDHLIAAVQNIAILAGAAATGVGARSPTRPPVRRAVAVSAVAACRFAIVRLYRLLGALPDAQIGHLHAA